jgi:predicted Co/Zn/Cd cation transporter (cation efflux family)
VVAVQALVLLGSFAYAATDAIGVILAGGSQTRLGFALAYSILALLASIVAYLLLRRMQKGSDLVAAEAVQWRASVALGLAMSVGFAAAWVLQAVGRGAVAPYMDPALVLVAAALILPAPVRMLRTSFRELLEGAPASDVTDPIHVAIDRVREEFGLPEPTTRIGKLGRKVYLELDFLVGGGEGWTIDHADRVRRRLYGDLSRPGQLLWINVELHTDPDWDA